jgi:hypothetical protein
MVRYVGHNGGGGSGVRELSRRLFGVAQTSKSAVTRLSKPASRNPVKPACKPAPCNLAAFAPKILVLSVLYVLSAPSARPVLKSSIKVNKAQ